MGESTEGPQSYLNCLTFKLVGGSFICFIIIDIFLGTWYLQQQNKQKKKEKELRGKPSFIPEEYLLMCFNFLFMVYRQGQRYSTFSYIAIFKLFQKTNW